MLVWTRTSSGCMPGPPGAVAVRPCQGGGRCGSWLAPRKVKGETRRGAQRLKGSPSGPAAGRRAAVSLEEASTSPTLRPPSGGVVQSARPRAQDHGRAAHCHEPRGSTRRRAGPARALSAQRWRLALAQDNERAVLEAQLGPARLGAAYQAALGGRVLLPAGLHRVVGDVQLVAVVHVLAEHEREAVDELLHRGRRVSQRDPDLPPGPGAAVASSGGRSGSRWLT